MISRTVAQGAVQALDAIRSRVALREATSVGRGVRVFGRPRVANDGELVVGDRVVLVSAPAPVDLLVAPGASLIIRDRALIESGASIRARGRVHIGRGARVGAGCILDDDGDDATGIYVGEGAWLEDGAVLLGGANVAPGSVVDRFALRAAQDHARPQGAPKRAANGEAELDPDDVDRRVRAVLGRLIFGAADIERSANLNQVKGWDSLAALRVLVALEKEFAVVLPHQLFARHPSLEAATPVILASVARRAELG
jgi:acyl carrier protein/acetyltransferase-like isoleucine patch superfamily enzyme